ncbi:MULTISPECIES: hypothetical protein [unclassified Carboxylicivirga]|uniref:hypothetical protein n=1 Tax=Carboxylicivirga TaxID=1628153 RepID=UPI003D336072
MKTTYIITLIFSTLIFANCTRSKLDSLPPYLYTYHLKFVDADNNNLLEDIDLNLLKNNFSLAPASENDLELIVESEYINKILYLKVSATSSQSERMDKIYFNVISEELFNDKESHEIETQWDWSNNLDNTPNKVTLDGNNLSSEVLTPSFQYFLVEQII